MITEKKAATDKMIKYDDILEGRAKHESAKEIVQQQENKEAINKIIDGMMDERMNEYRI